MKKSLFSIIAILISAFGYAQCMMYPVLLNERIQNSNLVIEGKVINKISFWNSQHNKIFTSNLIEVYKTFKGSSSAYIEIITEGGIVGDRMHKIEPSLQLHQDEMGVFTLIPNSEPSQFGKTVYEAYASAQGFIKYDVYTNTATEPFHKYENISSTLYDLIDSYTQANYITIRPVNLFQINTNNNISVQAVAAITGISPTTITAGTQSVLTITGSGFGTVSTPTAIGFRNADDGGATFISPIASEIVSWTSTQIQVKVPADAGTGVVRVQGVNSSQTLTISYAHLNLTNGGIVYNTKHINQSGGGYIWKYNTSFNSNTAAITAGTMSTLTITGTGFGTVSTPTAIGFRNADDGGATFISPIASEIVSWTSTQIQVKVPADAGTGVVRVQGVNSSQTLTISYAHLNASGGSTNYLTKHIGQSSGGYAWTYNSSFSSNANAKASFERAFQNWRCATFINWRINLTTSSISASASDNVNIITFNSSLPTGVLGNCGSYWAGCGSGASMSWYVDEIDIQFDPTPGSSSWQYGPSNPSASQYDFETVVLHELGHGHQLGHVINNSNVMHYAIGPATNKRVLSTTDINAGSAVMNRNTTAGGTCSNPLMTALTAGTCSLSTTLTSAISSPTAACVNKPVTFTNASSGNPTSYTWTTTGATPTTTNSINATFTFNSAGVKTVTLTVSNGTTTSSSTATINIQNPPSVTLTSANSTLCINGGAQTLVGSPSGGTYSGTGVQSNLFLPLNAGVGTHIATYNYTNTIGCSGSATFTFNVSSCTGIEQLSLNEFNIKPNPASDFLYVELINQHLVGMTIEIYDALGKLVQKEIISDINNKIDISNLNKGIYIVRCISKTGGQTTKRIIKD